MTIVLASASAARRALLERAGVSVDVRPVRLDEDEIRRSLVADGCPARDIADHLAEQKARRAAARADPSVLVLGSDQVLEFEGEVFGKPATPGELESQLHRLNGRSHKLHSAAVVYENAAPAWRHVSTVTMTMRQLSEEFIGDYVSRNWDEVRHSVGGYHIEDEGPRLFSRIDGSHFAILGLPLLEILSYLSLRGELST